MGRMRGVDRGTADEVLAGTVDEAALPEAYRGVASLLRSARGSLPAGDPLRGEQTLAAMAVAVSRPESQGRPARRRPALRATKLATATAAGVLSLFGGLTAAAALSGSVSDAVHDATGVRLPLSAEPHEPSGPTPAGTGATGSGSQACAGAAGAAAKTECPQRRDSGAQRAKAGGAKTEDTAGGSGEPASAKASDTGKDHRGGNEVKSGSGKHRDQTGGEGKPADTGGHDQGSPAKDSGGPCNPSGHSGSPVTTGLPNNSDDGHGGGSGSGNPSDTNRPHGNGELP